MGFSDISLVGSDTAMEAYQEVEAYCKQGDFQAALERLCREIQEDHGEYNTPGVLNVALILVDGETKLSHAKGFTHLALATKRIVQKLYSTLKGDEEYEDILVRLIDGLEAQIDEDKICPTAKPEDVDLVLYHVSCADGFTAAWAAWKRLGDQAEYIPVNYKETPPNVKGKHVAILDFSYKRHVLNHMLEDCASMVVLDHHDSALRELSGLPQTVFRMDRSGAYLSYLWFLGEGSQEMPDLVKYVQDRDLWTWEMPFSKEFSAGLQMFKFDFHQFDLLAKNPLLAITQGAPIVHYQHTMMKRITKRAVLAELDGVRMWVINTLNDWRSEIGHILVEQDENVKVAMIWFYHGRNRNIVCSLRSAPEVNLLPLVEKFGGGGHKNAAGFVWDGAIEDLVTFIDEPENKEG